VVESREVLMESPSGPVLCDGRFGDCALGGFGDGTMCRLWRIPSGDLGFYHD